MYLKRKCTEKKQTSGPCTHHSQFRADEATAKRITALSNQHILSAEKFVKYFFFKL